MLLRFYKIWCQPWLLGLTRGLNGILGKDKSPECQFEVGELVTINNKYTETLSPP
jgi:hypothetical protein